MLFQYARRLCIVVAGALALADFAACSNPTPLVPPTPPPATWLLLSDVHFTPFDDPALVPRLVTAPASGWHAIFATSAKPLSPYFHDTNFALFESALDAMRRTAPDPPVVVISGDFLGHNFPEQFAKLVPHAPNAVYQQFVDKTIAFLASEFDAAYPKAQFLITIGNNDGYCGDYRSTPKSPFLGHMAMAWQPLVNRNGNAPAFVSQFSLGGYYTARLPLSTTVPAIVLNSVFWSAYYENTCGTAHTDPGRAELKWLAAQLSDPAMASPLLLTHIPPGIDEYASAKGAKATPLYKEAYTQQLLSTLATKGVRLRAFLIGHIHHATFEVADTAGGQLGAFVISSISPNQGNNPAFVSASVQSSDPMLLNTTTYVLSLASIGNGWTPLYSFNTAYGVQGVDAPSLLRLQSTMAADSSVRATFFANYNSASATATPSPEKWRWYWCGHTNLTPAPYTQCVGR